MEIVKYMERNTNQHNRSTIKVQIHQSMKNLYDHVGNEMTVHYRIEDEIVKVIINRSCQECKTFGKLGDGELICTECHYAKDWLNRGMF